MLFRKMLRDMSLHKMQFVSIFLMAFLGVFIYAGIGGEWQGLQQTVDRYYEETGLAQATLYGTGFSPEDAAKVREIEGIATVQRRLSVETAGVFDNKPAVTVHVIEENLLSRPYSVSGEPFGSSDAEGIWLDHRFAQAKELLPGDSISLSYNGMTLTKIIRGTVYGSEHVYFMKDGELGPDFAAMGYAYLPVSGLPQGANVVYNQLLLDTSRSDWERLEEELSQALGGRYSVFMTRDNSQSVAMFQNEIAQHKAMGTVFPIAFLAVAVLTILTTMTRLVNSQRGQIGILKALGFHHNSILRHYISYGFWVSALGSLLGAATGPLALPRLFYPSMSGFYTLPVWEPAYSPSFLLMAGLSVLACTAVTYWACRSILQEAPSEALRPKAPKLVRRSLLEGLLLRPKTGFNTRWNLRDTLRNKTRSAMAVIGVLSCTALLVCAFGLQDSLEDVAHWQYNEINQFDAKLTIEQTATPAQISAVMDEVNGQALMEAAIELKADGVKKRGIAVIADQATLLEITDENRRFMELPTDGIAVSYKMARLLGVSAGDEISWHLYSEENWITSKIAAIYRSPTPQGIMLTREHFDQLGGRFMPTSILTVSPVAQDYEGISGIWSNTELADNWEEMSEAMNLMVYILIFGAVLLAVVVLYNLGLLSFTEKERELATLKVMGFQTGQIRGLLLTQNIWLSLVGIIIGIPAGKWLIDIMIDTMGDDFDMMTIIQWGSVAFSIFITLFLSVAVNLLFSRKIRRLDMVGSLKGVE